MYTQTVTSKGRSRGAAPKSRSNDRRIRVLKRRLRWIVNTAGDGTQAWFADQMSECGRPTHQKTISRWINEDDPATPNSKDLDAIFQFVPNVSADWLFGRSEANTIEEQFIESKIK